MKSGMEQVRKAVLLLLGVALGARVAWWLLEPLVPVLFALVVLGAVFATLRGWFRR